MPAHLVGKCTSFQKEGFVDKEREYPTFNDVKAAKEVIYMLMNKVSFGAVSPAWFSIFSFNMAFSPYSAKAFNEDNAPLAELRLTYSLKWSTTPKVINNN